MRNLPMERLVDAARAFSPDAWGQIYDRYYGRMLDYCYLRTGDRSAAEDLASEVFLGAVRSIGRYEYRGAPFSAWLYRIAQRVTADFLRKRAQRPTVPLNEDGAHPNLQTGDGTEASTLWHDVQAAIQQLTEDQQHVIVLRFLHGLSHEETAAAMGRSSGAVRILQHRALVALRELMPVYAEERR
jgi:RNA polymerase sigma-70 factor (ECF subfamily)